jgi:hypothetical protein
MATSNYNLKRLDSLLSYILSTSLLLERENIKIERHMFRRIE